MRKISNSRRTNLLKYLINESDYKPAKYYADRLNISTRTLFKEIEKINQELKNHQLEIKKKAHFGIKISGNWQEKLSYLNNERDIASDDSEVAERNFAIMKRLILESQIVTFDSLAERFFTSKTSIKSSLDLIERTFITPFSLVLSKTNHGTVVVGDEADIQKAIYAFVLDRFTALNEQVEMYEHYVAYLAALFPHKLIQRVNNLIQEKLIELEYTLDSHYKRNFLTYLSILLYRKSIGKQIDLDKHLLTYKKIMSLESYFVAKELLEELSDEYGAFDEQELIYVSLLLVANKIQKATTSKHISQTLETLIDRSIQKMSELVQVDLCQDQLLKDALVEHIPSAIFRMSNQISIQNSLIDDIRDEYAVTFRTTVIAMNEIEETYQINLTDDEIGFIMVHFQCAIERNTRVRKVFVICPNGIGTAELISLRLKKYLPLLDIVEVTSIDKLQKNEITENDLVISTIPLPDETLPFIQVSPLMNETDIKSVTGYYQHLLSETASTITLEKFQDYLDEELIFFNQNFTTKEEVLTFIANRLYEKGLVKQGFSENLLQRELLGRTDLNSGVAIPHANPAFVLKTQLVVIINNRPIRWTTQNVKAVFLICISEQDLKLARKLLSELYNIVNTKENVQKYIFDEASRIFN
ncbi:BglG family transcription antiterminator [Enterococcus pallens]|uniref:PTS system EIIA component n=1 Tax=Enterococcus pallens ATCC BAA-351 TaxID=1158607 RepID=R2QBR9_9ENTE|nr:BglG family transcription antiterminator [Enterococcus pallens]EOH93857.1 hypothetical protein UAU_02553 [Enterococcus pallens ATCC BAA-351]EOU24697.1 hypothetical protein I588_00684 [Enterococcus pallens ATCC BAA-351]